MFNGLNQFSHTPINLLTYSLIASFPQDDINKLIAPGGSCKNNPKDEFSKEELCERSKKGSHKIDSPLKICAHW